MSTKSETFPLLNLARLLSGAVGDEKAQDAVTSAARELGIRPTGTVTFQQALEVLEKIAATPGIVGVTARFAKSRLHLAAT